MTTLPVELLPAYKRPIDPKSVDDRMSEQLAFENAGRTAPGTLDFSDSKSKEKKSLFKRAATIAALGATVAGFMLAIERAYDYEQHVHQPSAPADLNSGKH